MSTRDEDRFHVRPGPPRQRGDAFINKVLRETSKAGGKARKIQAKPRHQPGARLGRGHVAARFAGRALSANARRVTIKTRLVNLKSSGRRSTATHLRYIERDGVDRQGGQGHAYGPTSDAADLDAFKACSEDDRHQFRFIVSPEDAEQLDDLRTYTRHLMTRMEADLGTRLEWVAVDHWNTDNPHTHLVLRGKDDTGKDLIIARDYIAEGMRGRAAELATEWLGPRTELEIQRAMQVEVDQERWTGLDRVLQRETAGDGLVHVERFAEPRLQHQRQALIGRLQRLQRMGLAAEQHAGLWAVHAGAETTLRAMGERGDIIRTMQRAMGSQQRELALFQPEEAHHAVVGRVVGKGLADELNDRGYLVVDGIDGKAHYIALPPRAELEHYPTGSVVEVKASTATRMADRNIASLAVEGIYRTDDHLAVAQGVSRIDRAPQDVVSAHVRRLEALRRAGIVERLSEGVWRVPSDLPQRGQQYDAKQLGRGAVVELKSHLSIQRQSRAIGATWLDQQLLTDGRELGQSGFGVAVREAMRVRADYLVSEGLAELRGGRLLLDRNLLETLRNREVEATARVIASETGLQYRAARDGDKTSGVYRRSVLLASGRFAMLDDGSGFSLVPWKSAIDQRLGQTMSAVVRNGDVSWHVGRSHGR